MKKLLATILVLALAASMLVGCGGSGSSSNNGGSTEVSTNAVENPDFGGLESEVAYEPNTEYDKYAIVEYNFEDIDTRVVAMVSADNAEEKFECHFDFYGDEQLSTAKKSGDTYEVLTDKTGFVTNQTPEIIAKAVAGGVWGVISK